MHNLDSSSLVLKAAWLLPITSAPIANGALVINQNKISAILPEVTINTPINSSQCLDYGSAIIVPGFINLHTHLEYSLLQPFCTDLAFFPWIRKLMETTAFWTEENRYASALSGARSAILNGTTFVVDSSYSGQAALALAETGLRGLVGLELFGINEKISNEAWQNWLQRFTKLTENSTESFQKALSTRRVRLTVAPHAPYTVCPALWRYANEFAHRENVPLMTHLAESPQEKSWFREGNSEIDQHLTFAFRLAPNPKQMTTDAFNLTDDLTSWKSNDSGSPCKHLERHGLLNANLLAAHTVQIDDEDLELLKQRDVAVAHCPRSNMRLGNGMAPISKFLKHSLRFGLGTDSLASCDDLSLLAEGRFAADLHCFSQYSSSAGGSVGGSERDRRRSSSKQIIEAITLNAAKCLSLENELGSLTPTKLADFAVFSFPEMTTGSSSNCDPYELLLYGNCQPIALYVGGRPIFLDESQIRPRHQK